jgi:rhodanese-related sulfurtransferase
MSRSRPPALAFFGGLLAFLATLSLSARAEFTNIDNDELARLMAAGVPVIDIRTEPEWKETGIVKGSRLMTFFDERGRADAPAFVEKLKAIAKPDEPVILICRSGNRTTTIAKFLGEQVGYKKVYNVRQGIKGWLREQRPVEPAAPTLAGCPAGGKC